MATLPVGITTYLTYLFFNYILARGLKQVFKYILNHPRPHCEHQTYVKPITTRGMNIIKVSETHETHGLTYIIIKQPSKLSGV